MRARGGEGKPEERCDDRLAARCGGDGDDGGGHASKPCLKKGR